MDQSHLMQPRIDCRVEIGIDHSQHFRGVKVVEIERVGDLHDERFVRAIRAEGVSTHSVFRGLPWNLTSRGAPCS